MSEDYYPLCPGATGRHPICPDALSNHLIQYAPKGSPLFIGHCWRLDGQPTPLAAKVACLVGKPGGRLVVYRCDGEQLTSREQFTWAERLA